MSDTDTSAPAEPTFGSDPEGVRLSPTCGSLLKETAMSEVRQLRPFAPGSAPRTGRVPGRKNKLNARSLKVINTLLADFAEHGAEAVQIMRIERPAEYVRMRNGRGLEDGAAEHGGSALVSISINRFFAEEPTVTIDGVSDDKPAV